MIECIRYHDYYMQMLYVLVTGGWQVVRHVLHHELRPACRWQWRWRRGWQTDGEADERLRQPEAEYEGPVPLVWQDIWRLPALVRVKRDRCIPGMARPTRYTQVIVLVLTGNAGALRVGYQWLLTGLDEGDNYTQIHCSQPIPSMAVKLSPGTS